VLQYNLTELQCKRGIMALHMGFAYKKESIDFYQIL